MPASMHEHLHMGQTEWLILGLFIFYLLLLLILLLQHLSISQQSSTKSPLPTPQDKKSYLLQSPEVQLLMLALPLELLWEIAQFPLYTAWHEGSWSYIFYGLAHCTLGDLMILVAVFWIVAGVNLDRHWINKKSYLNILLFTVLGASYTVLSEIVNVSIKGSWAYTELMPVVPIIKIGAMPFLQWILIPPVLLWLIRLMNFSKQQQNSSS